MRGRSFLIQGSLRRQFTVICNPHVREESQSTLSAKSPERTNLSSAGTSNRGTRSQASRSTSQLKSCTYLSVRSSNRGSLVSLVTQTRSALPVSFTVLRNTRRSSWSVLSRYYSSSEGLQALNQESEEQASSMAEGEKREGEEEKLYPAVDTYGPVTVRGSELEPGKKKKWCTCGLSKKAPWCDGAHKKTGFRSLKWEVPEKPQSIYQICNCKYTKSPPYCDGTHTYLPEVVLERQKNCPNKPHHEECLKMCTGCGWKVDF